MATKDVDLNEKPTLHAPSPSDVSTRAPTDSETEEVLSESESGTRDNIISRVYRRLFDYCKGDPGKLTLFTIPMLIASDLPIFFFTLLDILKLKSLFKYRLHYDPSQAGHLGIRKYPPNNLIWKTFKEAEFNFLFAYVVPGSLLIPLGAKLGIFVYETDKKDITWRRILREVFSIAVLSDLFFYWMHRTLHSPSLYKSWHKKHHYFKYTMALTHHYMEFKEALLFALPQALPPLFLGLLFRRKTHVVSMWIAFLFTQLNVIFGHSGWQIPFIPNWLPTLQADYHDFHHVDHTVNFGAIFPFTDMLFGTHRTFLPASCRESGTFPPIGKLAASYPTLQQIRGIISRD